MLTTLKEGAMKLNEINCDNLDEEEFDALMDLPHTEEGLAELISYLECFDSFTGYKFLFVNYYDIMSEDMKRKWQERAYQLFEILPCEDILP